MRARAVGEVSKTYARGRQVVEAFDLVVGVDGAAEVLEVRGEGVGDGLGAAAGHGPAAGVRGQGEDQAYGAGGEAAERGHDVRDEPGEEGLGLLVAEAAHQPGRRGQTDKTEPGQRDRVAGQRCQRQGHEVPGQRVPPGQEALDQPAVRAGVARSEGGGGLADRAGQHGGRAVGERVRHGQPGMQPLQAVPLQGEASEGGRVDTERVRGRARVVPEAGQGQLLRARSAAHGALRLEHGDREAAAGQLHGGGQSVRPRTHYDRIEHRRHLRTPSSADGHWGSGYARGPTAHGLGWAGPRAGVQAAASARNVLGLWLRWRLKAALKPKASA